MKGLIRQGQGPSVVLQHGFLSGSQYWQQIIEKLSIDFDVIALDLPGFAHRKDEPAIDSIKAMSEDLLGRLDQLGVKKFHLCGHSMGGMIAQETALIAPHRVDRLILYATGPDGSMPGRFETFDESIAKIDQQGIEPTLQRTTASWFLKGCENDCYENALKLARQASLKATMAGFNAMKTWHSIDRLKHIDNNTLVVWPDKDRSYSFSHPHALNKNIKHSSLAVIPGCAHNAHLEKPDYFVMVVKDFLLAE